MFELPFKLEELVEFILQARKQGYAGNAERTKTPQRPGFKEYQPYKEGNFEYVDSYAGNYFAPGQEVVRWKEIPVWNMAYNGGIIPKHHGNENLKKKCFGFLHLALQESSVAHPYRGPYKYTNKKWKDWEYHNDSHGNIIAFTGKELIVFDGIIVFSQDYIGGLIVHNKPLAEMAANID